MRLLIDMQQGCPHEDPCLISTTHKDSAQKHLSLHGKQGANLIEKKRGKVKLLQVDKITNAAERNETSIGIFLDLPKAFDTIDRTRYLLGTWWLSS